MPENESTPLMIHVTRRLFIALGVLVIAALVLMIVAATFRFEVLPAIVVAAGCPGGFVGLHVV